MKLRAPDAADSPRSCPACPRRHFLKFLALAPNDSSGPTRSFGRLRQRQQLSNAVVRSTATVQRRRSPTPPPATATPARGGRRASGTVKVRTNAAQLGRYRPIRSPEGSRNGSLANLS